MSAMQPVPAHMHVDETLPYIYMYMYMYVPLTEFWEWSPILGRDSLSVTLIYMHRIVYVHVHYMYMYV